MIINKYNSDMKEKILQILENNLHPTIHGQESSIHRIYFDDIAEQIIKLFAIHDVNNSASDIENNRDMEDFGNYAGIGFDD